MWIAICFLLAFVVAGVGIALWRARQFKMLAERGVPLTGTVLRRFQSGKAGGPERTKRITWRERRGAAGGRGARGAKD